MSYESSLTLICIRYEALWQRRCNVSELMKMMETRRLIENGTRFIDFPKTSDSEIGTSMTMLNRADFSIVLRRLTLHVFL